MLSAWLFTSKLAPTRERVTSSPISIVQAAAFAVAYAEMGFGEGTFPVTEAIHREVLSLPMGPHLERVQQDRVIQALR